MPIRNGGLNSGVSGEVDRRVNGGLDGGKCRAVVIAVLTALTGSVVLAGAVAALGMSVEREAVLRVDLTRMQGPVKPLFRDFAQGGETTDPEYYAGIVEPMRRLAPRMIRFDHALSGFVNSETAPHGLVIDASPLYRMLDLVAAMGAEPMICLSYFPPAAGGGPEGVDPPADFTRWLELVRQTIATLEERPGPPIRYYEIWNEPNLEVFWSGSREHFLEFYAVTSRALREWLPEARIGGPAFAGLPEDWVDAFLDDVREAQLPLDFFSWHIYHQAPEDVVQGVADVQRRCRDRGLSPELILNEWNFHAGMVPENDDHRGAAYAAEHLAHLVDTDLAYAPFFEPKDGWRDDEPFWGRWGLFNYEDVPKANYYAFLAHAQLGRERVAMTRWDAGRIGGIATVKDGNAVFTLYNNSPHTREVILEIGGFPHAPGQVEWRRRLIDASHSNPARGAKAELQAVEHEFPARGDSRSPAQFNKRVRLTPWSVSLCELGARETAPPRLAARFVRGGGDFPVLEVEALDGGPRRIERVTLRLDTGQSLPVADAPSARPPLDLESGRPARFDLALPPTLTAAGREVYVMAAIETADGVIHAGTRVDFAPTLAVAAAVSRWPGGVGEATVTVAVRNPSRYPVSGPLRLRFEDPLRFRALEGIRYDLAPGAGKDYRFVFSAETPSATNPRVHEITAEVDISGASEGDHRLTSAVLLRPEFVARRVDPRDRPGRGVRSRPERDATSRLLDPDGQTCAVLDLTWSPGEVLLAVTVTDPEFEPYDLAADASPAPRQELLWSGDSLQLALDETPRAAAFPEYDDGDIEAGFALTTAGPRSWLWKSPGAEGGREGTLPFSAERIGETIVYQVRIPAGLLGRERWASGDCFGLSVLINDWDGGVRHLREWGGGIPEVKEPWRAMAIALE